MVGCFVDAAYLTRPHVKAQTWDHTASVRRVSTAAEIFSSSSGRERSSAYELCSV